MHRYPYRLCEGNLEKIRMEQFSPDRVNLEVLEESKSLITISEQKVHHDLISRNRINKFRKLFPRQLDRLRLSGPIENCRHFAIPAQRARRTLPCTLSFF